MRVVGVDLSLTATGYADERGSGVIRVKVRGPERLAEIRDELMRRIGRFTPALPDEPEDGGWAPGGRPLVVLEGYSYASKGRSVVDIGELGGVIRLLLWEEAIPYIEVPPAVLKKFATGRGNAGKPEMLDAAIRHWAYEDSPDDNAVDAYLLRLMGISSLHPQDSLPRYAQEAIDKVTWSELVRA